MPLDVDRLADALFEGTRALLAKELGPLRAENEALKARIAAVEAVEPVVLPDFAAMALEAAAEAARMAVAAIPAPQDGKDADPELVRQVVAEAVRAAVDALPPAEPGKDADPAELAALRAEIAEVRRSIPAPVEMPEPVDISGLATKEALAALAKSIPPAAEPIDVTPFARKDELAEAVAASIAAIPMPKDGENGKDADAAAIEAAVMERIAPQVAEALAVVAEKVATVRDGKDGKLPIVKAWADGVHYAGDVVTHRGATWQATQDTGREPGSADWACLAAQGEPGAGFTVCGTYDPEATYEAGCIVMRDGSSFVALRTEPGECPGDGWQLWASRGKRGATGDRGDKGETGDRGEKGDMLLCAELDGDELRLTHADGSVVKADLSGLAR